MTAGPVLARLDRPRTSEAVTLAVLADPHVAVDRRGTWKVCHRARERLRTAVHAANEHADAAVIAGDLTADGRPAEFDAVDDALAGLSIPWRAVPGNHDVPKADDDHQTPSIRAFRRRYDHAPFAWQVGELTVCCLDTATDGGDLRDTWGGRAGAQQRAWLGNRLAEVETPIVVAHHNFGPLPDHPGGPPWSRFPAGDGSTLATICANRDAPLAITAHHHVPALLDHGGTTEVLAPAVCSFPQVSMHVEVDSSGTTLRLVPLASQRGAAEARCLARDGSPLGRGVLSMTERRLARLPLS